MKITKSKLREIIREEIQKLNEKSQYPWKTFKGPFRSITDLEKLIKKQRKEADTDIEVHVKMKNREMVGYTGPLGSSARKRADVTSSESRKLFTGFSKGGAHDIFNVSDIKTLLISIA